MRSCDVVSRKGRSHRVTQCVAPPPHRIPASPPLPRAPSCRPEAASSSPPCGGRTRARTRVGCARTSMNGSTKSAGASRWRWKVKMMKMKELRTAEHVRSYCETESCFMEMTSVRAAPCWPHRCNYRCYYCSNVNKSSSLSYYYYYRVLSTS